MQPEPPPSEPRFDPRHLAWLVCEMDRRDYYERSELLDRLMCASWPTISALCQ